jgi:hypothetical protein
MANADAPRGFRPIPGPGGTYSGATVRCAILAADGTATFVGDLVKLSGTASADGYPSVAQAAVGDLAFGVVVSFEPDRTNLELKYRTASTLRYCNVITCPPTQEFVVQASGSIAITDVGNDADFVVGSGDTTTGLSGMELDSANIGEDGMIILGIIDRPDNEIGTNADVRVRINESAWGDYAGV